MVCPGRPQTTDFFSGCEFGNSRATKSWEGGARTLPQAEALWKVMLEIGKMTSVHSVGDGLGTGSMAAVTPSLSLKP